MLFTIPRFVALTFAFAAILVLRDTQWVVNPTFFAEDGTVFYRDQLMYGWKALFLPYNGYFHLLPRLAAAAAGLAPAAAAPAVSIAFAFIAQALAMASLLWPGFGYLVRSERIRLAAAFVFIAALPGREMIAHLCNTQWHLLLPALLLLFLPNGAEGGSYRLPSWAAGALAAVMGLTCSGMILLLPFSLWRAWRRAGRERTIGLAFSIATAIQLVCLFFVPRMSAHAQMGSDPMLIAARMIMGLVVSWIYRVAMPITIGGGATYAIDMYKSPAPFLLAVIAGAVAFTWLWLRANRGERLQLGIGAWITLTAIGSALYAANLIDWFQSPTGNVMFQASRYFVAPCYVLIGLFAILLKRAKWLRKESAKGALLLMICIGGITGNFRIAREPVQPWKPYVKQIEAWREARRRKEKTFSLRVPILPPGQELVLPDQQR